MLLACQKIGELVGKCMSYNKAWSVDMGALSGICTYLWPSMYPCVSLMCGLTLCSCEFF